ncbi:MAG: hypothetical protein LBD05_01580 [Mycoplasmataceae bacterium]|nr:hypothetical protein [Mycoplasmataceae bacterium]
MNIKKKIVIFGVTGDLSKRMLLPSLDKLMREKLIDDVEIIGISRRIFNPNDIINNSAIIDKSNTPIKLINYTIETNNNDEYIKFKNFLNIDKETEVLIYLSVPPTSSLEYVEMLGKNNLNSNNIKLLIEKPFGWDLDSANKYFSEMEKYFNSNQILCIDHYLLKNSVENFINLRKEKKYINKWNSQSIKSIEVLGLEKIGIEGRTVFYEQTGALRDFVQNHLIQLLTLTIVNIDNSFELKNLIKEKNEVIKNLKISNIKNCIRGQYKKYREEVKNDSSIIETFTNIPLESSDSTWLNTKFYLITGKSLNEKKSAIVIYFKDGTIIDFDVNKNFSKIINKKEYILSAYESVFLNALNNNKTFFANKDEIIKSWEIFQPLIDYWKEDHNDIVFYNENEKYDNIKPLKTINN